MIVTTTNKELFTINYLSISPLNPADATTYYGDELFGFATTSTLKKRALPYNCILIGASIRAINNTTSCTSENATVSINNITQASTVVLSNAVAFNGAPPVMNTVSVTGLSTSFTAGDQIQMVLVTPTWATNPTAVYLGIDLYFLRS